MELLSSSDEEEEAADTQQVAAYQVEEDELSGSEPEANTDDEAGDFDTAISM